MALRSSLLYAVWISPKSRSNVSKSAPSMFNSRTDEGGEPPPKPKLPRPDAGPPLMSRSDGPPAVAGCWRRCHQHHEPDLQQQAEQRGDAAEPAEQAMTEQEPEQAGTEEAGSKAAEQAGPIEQAAEHAAGLARRRGLPAERARLAGLRHAAFHWRGSVRGRARGGRRAERVGAAAAGASAASRAGVGLARHKGKRRQGGEQNDERTKPQTKRSHRSLSRRFPEQSL